MGVIVPKPTARWLSYLLSALNVLWLAIVLAMSAEEIQHLADVRAAMRDNADYAETNNESKAGKFATALRQYIVAIPQTASRGSQGEELRFDMETLRELLKKAEDFLMRRRSRANGGFRLRGFTRMRPRADGDARRGSTP